MTAEARRELVERLAQLAQHWRESRAHTYASENADHYRGFDAGQLRAAEALECWLPIIESELARAELEARLSLAEAELEHWRNVYVRVPDYASTSRITSEISRWEDRVLSYKRQLAGMKEAKRG